MSLTQDLSASTLKLRVNDTETATKITSPLVFFNGVWLFGTLVNSDFPKKKFKGCLSKIKINGEVISLNVTNQYGLLTVERGSLTSGCLPPNPCASNPCPGKVCVAMWQAYECIAPGKRSDDLGIGVIAGIVFAFVLMFVIIVVVVAVKKKKSTNEFADKISNNTKSGIEKKGSLSSRSSESMNSRQFSPSRHSLSDSGVDVRNQNKPSPHVVFDKNNPLIKNPVIALGSPDEYMIVASQHDSVSDDRENRFTDSESETMTAVKLTSNLTISSLPVHVKQEERTAQSNPTQKSPLNFKKKVPFLINRGFLKDPCVTSLSTSISDEPESIEMQKIANIENAEQYSIGNASFTTYSDLNDSCYNVSRFSDDRFRYKPSLQRFSESDDSMDHREMKETFEVLDSQCRSDSSDGEFTASECEYGAKQSDELSCTLTPLSMRRYEEVSCEKALREYQADYCDSFPDYDNEIDLDEESIDFNDLLVERPDTKRENYHVFARLVGDIDVDDDVEIV